MAYFGRRPEKPGSVPGSQSGGAEERKAQRIRGVVGRVERRLSAGRSERQGNAARNARSAR